MSSLAGQAMEKAIPTLDAAPADERQPQVPALAKPLKAIAAHRVAALDGIRGFAVAIVMIGHAGFLPAGGAGVDMFFVLSGFLITGLLLEEKHATGRVGLFNFYMRRVLRLAPALALMVTLWLIASAILHVGFRRQLEDSAMAAGYIANWTLAFGTGRPLFLGHTWSLCIEEQFYALWPWITLGIYGLFGRSRLGGEICLAGAIGVMAYRYWMSEFAGASLYRVYFALDTRSDALLLGAALAFLNIRLPKLAAEILGWLGAAALIAYLAPYVYPFGASYVIPAACTAVILVGLLNAPSGSLAKLLSWRPLAWLGMISYGLYLFHYPIIRYMKFKQFDSWIILLVELPLALLVATLSFYLLERPCLRLKDRFRRPVKSVDQDRGRYAARNQVVSAES
jgi:peptidoglycan/LPS O-acetylase OafA/YrhL